MTTMKALVYRAVGDFKLETRPKPTILEQTDVIIKVTKTTICGTDLHIKAGGVASVAPGRIIGHEGVGIVEQAGSSVQGFKKGDHVLISGICACSSCDYCRKGMMSHCTTGGWVLGNTIDGIQAEYVRVPHADSSLHPIPAGANEGALVLLSDIFPTSLECGVLNGKVEPGSTVVIVGAGPVGLATLITAQLYSPSVLILVDIDASRLEVAKSLGATHTILSAKGVDVEKQVKALTDGKGCETVIEAAGFPETFEICQKLVAPGGVIANIGVHGTSASLHLEDLWAHNISITTRLVDTVSTPMLLKLCLSGKIDPSKLFTHKFAFKDIEAAYETFGAAAETQALKVLIEM